MSSIAESYSVRSQVVPVDSELDLRQNPPLWTTFLTHLIDLNIFFTIAIFKLREVVIKLAIISTRITLHVFEIPLAIWVVIIQISHNVSRHKSAEIVNGHQKSLLTVANVHDMYWKGELVTIVQTNDIDSHCHNCLAVSNEGTEAPLKKRINTVVDLKQSRITSVFEDDSKAPVNEPDEAAGVTRYRKRLRNSGLFVGK